MATLRHSPPPGDDDSFDFDLLPALPRPRGSKTIAMTHPSLSRHFAAYVSDVARGSGVVVATAIEEAGGGVVAPDDESDPDPGATLAAAWRRLGADPDAFPVLIAPADAFGGGEGAGGGDAGVGDAAAAREFRDLVCEGGSRASGVLVCATAAATADARAALRERDAVSVVRRPCTTRDLHAALLACVNGALARARVARQSSLGQSGGGGGGGGGGRRDSVDGGGRRASIDIEEFASLSTSRYMGAGSGKEGRLEKGEVPATASAASASSPLHSDDEWATPVAAAEKSKEKSPPPSKESSGSFSEIRPKPASKATSTLKDDELDGLDVLVVEDNHFQLRIIRATLQNSGVSLDVALHGEEAVDRVRGRIDRGEKLYDLVLMDSQMPIMDGATASREIRALEKAHREGKNAAAAAVLNPETMIIVGLSAEAGHEYEREARAAGMDGALGKPCRPETMRKTLKEVHAGRWKRGSFNTAAKRAVSHF